LPVFLLYPNTGVDDYEFSAHKALTGNTEFSLGNPDYRLVPEIDASFGHNCYKEGSQFRLCDPGFEQVGSDRDGIDCSGLRESECGRKICCPVTSGMTDCMWRGSGGDCNGQCHEGEVKITASSWGGTPGESSPTMKCNRGDKAFCCRASSYNSLTEGCRWTDGCSGECNKDEESVAYARNRWGWSTVFCNGNHYCCKKDRPIPFRSCHWVGQGDCADNTCSKSEVTLWTNDQDDSYSACAWWRHKALCCTPNSAALNKEICDYDACADNPAFCNDEFEDDDLLFANWTEIDDGLEYDSEHLAEKHRTSYPGLPRRYSLEMAKHTLEWFSRPYPTGIARNWNYLFRPGTGLSTMLLKGSFKLVIIPPLSIKKVDHS
jgi:chitinase